MSISNQQDFLCCEYSRQAGEQLFATATRADVWLLLEYNRPWGAKAFEESELAPAVKDHLNDQLKRISNARLQFIRRLQPAGGIAFYIALAREENPILYQFRLSGYEDLLALDIAGVAAGDEAYQEHISSEPLFTVCTNARRDVSCGRKGARVYREMLQHGGDSVWQTAHIGGHRFAATCVWHPYGVVYGRIEPGESERIVDAHRQQRIVLEHYRGRSCYDSAVQAADYFLREQTGICDLPGFRLLGVESLSEDTSAVRFASVADGNAYRIDVLKQDAGVRTYQNSTDAEPSPVPQYRLVRHEPTETNRA